MIDLFNLERLPETLEELEPNTYNPEFILDLNKRLNEQAGRIETMLTDIITQPDVTLISYTDILTWRSRMAFFQSTGQAKKAEALRKARLAALDFDADDEEDEEGYKNFLDNEFTQS